MAQGFENIGAAFELFQGGAGFHAPDYFAYLRNMP